jgi:hypothetical protein
VAQLVRAEHGLFDLRPVLGTGHHHDGTGVGDDLAELLRTQHRRDRHRDEPGAESREDADEHRDVVVGDEDDPVVAAQPQRAQCRGDDTHPLRQVGVGQRDLGVDGDGATAAVEHVAGGQPGTCVELGSGHGHTRLRS